ncbi:MAG: hypothetical protein Ct9H300mP14_12810 [Gammaproteobacteria bacterium]|nr:MAG: hypothetical protein Ct9H300mP14_12810 [Gammaproteobacteria bacterium]
MQAFSEQYFQDNPRNCSVMRVTRAFRGCCCPRSRALVDVPLTRTETKTEITLENLVQFFTHPVRVLLRDVLDIRLESADVLLQTREPLSWTITPG